MTGLFAPLWSWLAAARYFPALALSAVRLLSMGTARHRQSMRLCREALGRTAPVPGGSPLRRIAPGVLEVQRRWFSPPDPTAPVGLLVVHVLGAGEHAHGLLPGLEKICLVRRQLSVHRHLIVDTPPEAAAYEDPATLAVHTWRAIRPVLASEQLPVLFVGLGRGAAVALELAARANDMDGRRVGVCMLSPELVGPVKRPAVWDFIDRLGPWLGQLAAAESRLGESRLRAQRSRLRRLHARVAAYMLAELHSDSRHALRWLAWDISQRPPIPALQRLSMESGLRIRRLERQPEQLAEAVAGRRQLSAQVLFGANDAWLPVDAGAARCREALRAASVDRERANVEVLPGWGHAIGREIAGDYGALGARIAQLGERVLGLHEDPRQSYMRLTAPAARRGTRDSRPSGPALEADAAEARDGQTVTPTGRAGGEG